MPRPRLLVPVALVVAAAGFALAQPGGGRPGSGGPGAPGIPGQPGQPGGGGGQPGFNPQQLVDRMMEMDANGDGKLARSEVPAQFAERNFDRFDANTDGFVDRAELEVGAANMGGNRGGAGRIPFGRAMDNIHTALHGLEDSAMTPATLTADLALAQSMQEGFLAAKFQSATERLEAPVVEQFGGDLQKARMEMRAHLIEGLVLALELETALMDGDAESARELLAAIEEAEHEAHDRFRVD